MPIGKIALLNEIAKRLDKILSDGDYGLELAQLDLDTAALDDLHLHLDRFCSVDISDNAWTGFQTLGDVVTWYLNAMNDKKIKRQYSQIVNMPQMALTGLSESWLFKEMGDCHWHMLCEDLGLKSNAIFDEFRNRLYATFVRIQIRRFQQPETVSGKRPARYYRTHSAFWKQPVFRPGRDGQRGQGVSPVPW